MKPKNRAELFKTIKPEEITKITSTPDAVQFSGHPLFYDGEELELTGQRQYLLMLLKERFIQFSFG